MPPNYFAASRHHQTSMFELPLVLKMAANVQNPDYDYFEVDEESDSEQSDVSEDVDFPVERIIAEFVGKNNHVWYLVKWLDCPLVRSSWECGALFRDTPWILDEWKAEKQRQAEGKSKPLDIAAFNKAVLDVEVAERQRRRLRSFRKQAEGIINAISQT
jgi:hypothetical protein